MPTWLMVLLLGLLLLLWGRRGGLGWAMNGHSWLGHKVGICCHLVGHRVARQSHGGNRLVWSRGVTGNGGLDAINSGGGESNWGGAYGSGLRRRRLITWQSSLG